MRRSALVCAIALAATLYSAEAVLPIGVSDLVNTGVDSSGNVLPYGSLDLHYQLSGSATAAYAVNPATDHPDWVNPPSGSVWISPDAPLDSPPGLYIYTLTFYVTGVDPEQVVVSGKWATDNDSELWLNGANTGLSRDIYGFKSLLDFSIADGFLLGENTLEFRVNNPTSPLPPGTSPTGLLVSDIGASIVPEPTTFALLGFGSLALAAGRRRR